MIWKLCKYLAKNVITWTKNQITHISRFDFYTAISQWGQWIPQEDFYEWWDMRWQLRQAVLLPRQMTSMTLDYTKTYSMLWQVLLHISVFLMLWSSRNIVVCFEINICRQFSFVSFYEQSEIYFLDVSRITVPANVAIKHSAFIWI